MHGYWRNPDETARVLKDGWLATGDVGHFDDKGRIVITDRKKDLIVNDKGDNVSPQRIEGMLTLQPEIAQAMVYGDRRPHLVALLVPDPEIASKRFRRPDLHQRGCSARSTGSTPTLSVIEKVRRFIVADEPFTIENEQLTPSMKIRRHVIRKVYGERLDALYLGLRQMEADMAGGVRRNVDQLGFVTADPCPVAAGDDPVQLRHLLRLGRAGDRAAGRRADRIVAAGMIGVPVRVPDLADRPAARRRRFQHRLRHGRVDRDRLAGLGIMHQPDIIVAQDGDRDDLETHFAFRTTLFS
jgi:hypothetical protein